MAKSPLGVMDKFKLSKDQLQKLQLIDQLDLSVEKAAVLASKTFEPRYIDLVEREFKRFLALKLLFKSTEYPLVPSFLVDALWHQLILNTPKYRMFCDAVYGCYLDHTPEASRARAQAINAGEVYAQTKAKLREAFGAVAHVVWDESGYCSGECSEGLLR